MIHRTFRSLDRAPKLVGFTVRQWLALIFGGGGVIAAIYALHISTRPAITLVVFLVGLPAALAYVSESGGLQLGLLLADMCRWRGSRHVFAAADDQTRARGLLVTGEQR